MSEWKEYFLKDFAEIQTGPFGSLLHASDYVSEGTPSIMPTNIGSRLNIVTDNIIYVGDNDINRLQKYLVNEGDIVYSRRGDVEKCALINEKQTGWLCGTGCLRIRIVKKGLSSKFCAYYLSAPDIKSWVLNSAVGTTMPNLNTTILGKLPLLIPELSEQTAIAEVLSSLDDKIDLLHRQNKTLEQLAETLFRQWFEVDSNNIKPLGELANVTTGKGLKRDEFIDKGTYPILGANGEIGRANKYLTDERIIITGRVGTLGEVKISEDKVWISDNVLIIKPTEGSFFYPIYFTLRQFDFESINAGSTQPLVTQTDLKNIDINFGEAGKLTEFEAFCKGQYQKIKSNTQQICTLTQLRDTLLPKLMSGEVRVNI